MKLEVSDLCFAYRNRPVLMDISFHTSAGEFLSVLGPNGAGKSTLFRCVLGILKDYQGCVRVDGRDTKALSPREMARLIAYIPQIHRPTFGYPAFDMVLMGASHGLSPFVSPGRAQAELARAAMARLGIEALAEREYSRLSGGEQQLVLVARALAQQSRVLVMDEPTSSLDFGNQLKVLERVRELTGDGYTVLLSTHNPQHALGFSHRVLALKEGRVAAFGETRQTLTPALVRELYGVEAEFVKTSRGSAIVPLSGGDG